MDKLRKTDSLYNLKLINEEFTALKTTEKIINTLHWMDSFACVAVPVEAVTDEARNILSVKKMLTTLMNNF